MANLKPDNPNLKKNYTNVTQNSEEWQKIRKNKVTASRLPGLLGFLGHKKFEIFWKIVNEGLQENEFIKNNANFIRGHKFETEALNHFNKISGCHAISCGFFELPDDESYGASPDGLVVPGILIEIKTRAANSEGPLLDIKKCPSYFIQVQIQMACTETKFCILMSYHPETKTATYFMIQKNELLWGIIKEITDSILRKKPILSWNYHDTKFFSDFGKSLIGQIPDFNLLKPLRTYVNKLLHKIPAVEFTLN